MRLLKKVKGMEPFQVEVPDNRAENLIKLFPGVYSHIPAVEDEEPVKTEAVEDLPQVNEDEPTTAPAPAEGEETLDEDKFGFTLEELEKLDDEQLRVLYQEAMGIKPHPSMLRKTLINKLLG